jgi:hypothetical protein
MYECSLAQVAFEHLLLYKMDVQKLISFKRSCKGDLTLRRNETPKILSEIPRDYTR